MNDVQFKTIKDVELEVARLKAAYGFKKVNLHHGDGEMEGVWTVPCSQEDQKAMDDDNLQGKAVMVRLANQPLGWGGRTWGALVKATTQGIGRPQAELDDQTEHNADASAIRELALEAGYMTEDEE